MNLSQILWSIKHSEKLQEKMTTTVHNILSCVNPTSISTIIGPLLALWKKNVHGHLKIFFRLNSDAFVQYNTLGALWNNAIQTLQLINTEKSFFSSVSPLLYSETSICYMQVDPDNVFFAAFLLSGPFIVIFLHRNFTPCI